MHSTRIRRKGGIAVAGATVAAFMTGALLGGVSNGAAASAVRPTNLDPPTISGKTVVGELLVAQPGRWANSPTDYDYQWRRCDENGGSCSSISGATSKEYRLKPVDRENTLRVRVTAKNADGSSTATSVPTAVVTSAPAPPTTCARAGDNVSAQDLTPPDRLSIDRQDVQPSTIGRSTSTVTARFRVSACNGKPVQGALVYVTAVPYNQFTVPPEAQTGADGWAQVELRRLDGYPATPRQQLLVMFVRARKSGESELGGISTRRLVSFPVDLGR